ncbi:hypothetical protein D9Q98_009772 [Chlorella vulgaris]|uniref:Uncharacterized protein n=1 Tax=Chlorella vulgaris TaxID=3077 RepID=A0A9D4YSR3_CHLVU|nr:hypothetical protein D9Q98_009772 [Chlorella vulgaris]
MDAHLAPAALLVELQQCRDALGREVLTPEMEIVYIGISVFLTLFAGLMAGLTLGLLSIDKIDLEVIKRSGSAHEVWLAQRVEPVLARPHFLLATLLLCNSMAMEALPLFLDRLLNPAAAIIISVTAILVFGEVVPQAVCKRYGLQVGAYMAWFVSFLMLLTAAITWPIGKLLDWVLGAESPLFKRRELKALMSIHADPMHEDGEGGPTLTADEVQIIQGALDMASKPALDSMTPFDKVFALSSDAEVTDELLWSILRRGHSRLPVYQGEDKQNIVGLVIVKELLMVDEDAGVRIRDLRLRDLPFISADTLLYDVLKVFRHSRFHMACLTRPVANSSRLEVVGIITIEDVLEELLQQEIVDETDQYVDNLQTVPTDALRSLQQLPPSLRKLLTRSIIMSTPHRPATGTGQDGRARPQHRRSQSDGMAAATGAVIAASHGRDRSIVAAAAAAGMLLSSPRRGRAAATKGGADWGGEVERRRGGDEGVPPELAGLEPLSSSGGSAPSTAKAAGLLGQDKPPIPRRSASLRGLRDPRGASRDRAGGAVTGGGRQRATDALRQPLLLEEGEHEGEALLQTPPEAAKDAEPTPVPGPAWVGVDAGPEAALLQQQVTEAICEAGGEPDEQQRLLSTVKSPFQQAKSGGLAAQQRDGRDASDMV